MNGFFPVKKKLAKRKRMYGGSNETLLVQYNNDFPSVMFKLNIYHKCCLVSKTLKSPSSHIDFKQ